MQGVQPYLESAKGYLVDALDFAHSGFMQANVILGLLIALIAAFMLSKYTFKAVIGTTIGATVLFVLAQVLVPVLDHNAPFRLPDIMVVAFWRQLASLALGLFVVITLFYVVKKTVLKGGGGH